MFGLFVNDDFFSFWQNSIGDIFLDNTISGLGLNPSHVDLVYFNEIGQPPAYFSFNESKDLIIYNQVVTPSQVATVSENGDPVLDENQQPIYHNEDVISYEISSTIAADFYSAKGIIVKDC